MRLTSIREYLNKQGIAHSYIEEDGCGSSIGVGSCVLLTLVGGAWMIKKGGKKE